MVCVHQTPEVDKVLADLHREIVEQHRIATTLGYGPSFLHSTAQMHKGRPDTGLFLPITASHERDMPVPGEPYTFGVVADAQALGDLQALPSSGRRVIRMRSSQSYEAALSRLTSELASQRTRGQIIAGVAEGAAPPPMLPQPAAPG